MRRVDVARAYRIISADSHLEISPELWTSHMPAKYQDRAPRLVKLADGGVGTVIEGRPMTVLGLAVTGKPYEEHRICGITYEGNPGTGTPEQRVQEQDEDGVDAEVLFSTPNRNSFWRGIKDDDAYRAVVRAYNEFLGEEYCAFAPDRLLGMGMIPSTGVDDAIAEMEYCARGGLKGVALNSFPNGKGFPTPDDDRFWTTALAMNMPVTVHVGFPQEGPVFKYRKEPREAGFGSDPVWLLTRFGGGTAQNAIQLMMAGVFDRFPALRIYFAETMIGWLPYYYEQLDDIYERTRHWALNEYGLEPLPRSPSEYLREFCLWGFLRDPFGVEMRDRVGVDRIMWGSDFPHSAGNWPHSLEVINEMFAGASETDRQKVICGNAQAFFHLEGETSP
jgi:uncharacterized protein